MKKRRKREKKGKREIREEKRKSPCESTGSFINKANRLK